MRPDVPVHPSTSPGPRASACSRGASIMIAAVIVAAMLSPWWKLRGDGERASRVAPACARWDEQARDAIARRVQGGGQDAELRQLSEAIFLVRRARRNCEEGWMTLACQDYLTVIRGGSLLAAPGIARPGCTLAVIEDASGAH